MPSITLDCVISKATLHAAWLRVHENRGCAGADGQSIDEFELDLSANLSALQAEVRTSAYRPQPLLRTWIPKSDGGKRPLSIPAVRDRLLQTAVAIIITPVFEAEFEDCSFAYRKGRSVDQAVQRVVQLRDEGFRWVVDGDIEAFFDEIDHDLLMTEVGKLVPDAGICHLIQMWLEADVVDGDLRTRIDKGVPQGAPISPLLSNLYLDHLDEMLLDSNHRLVRFADDFLVLCKNRAQAEKALELTEETLEELRLQINTDKTRIVDFSAGFRFLGVQFIRSLAFRPVTSKLGEAETAPDARVCQPTAGTLRTDSVNERMALPAETTIPTPHTTSLSEEDLPLAQLSADQEPPTGHDPRLQTLYLMAHGTVLGKASRRLVVRHKGRIIQEIPAIKVDQVMVFGNSQITTQAMQFCLRENIPIYLLSENGRYFGVVDSYSTDPVLLHKDQFTRADDPAFCLQLARVFVRGKITNSRVVLRRLARRREAPELLRIEKSLKKIAGQLNTARTLHQVRGFEGIAARSYFGALSSLLEPAWHFNGRAKRPPPDPVNAMLSYGYTLLFYNVYSMLRARGLNPHVGYLHPLRSGHPALASDMIEEFRAIIVDVVVFNLVVNGKVQPRDFSFSDGIGGQCLLSPGVRDRLIRGLESKLNTTITHPVRQLRLDYRRCIEHQVRELVSVIRSRRPEYRPMVLR